MELSDRNVENPTYGFFNDESSKHFHFDEPHEALRKSE
jgi:hypothetical protein